MEEKEEAKRLIDKFSDGGMRNWSKAKECALICVDEVVRQIPVRPGNYDPTFEYWRKVKQEIEKM